MKPSSLFLRAGSRVAFIVSVSFCLAPGLQAADLVWTTNQTGDFTDATKYSLAAAPAASGDSVSAEGAFSIAYGSGTYGLTNLVLSGASGGGSFSQSGGDLTIGTLYMGRAISGGNSSGGASRIPSFNLTGGTVNVGSVLFGNGANTAAPVAGIRIIQSAGTFNFTGTSLTVSGPTTGQSSLNVSGGSFNANNATLIYLGNGTNDAKGLLNLSGNASFNATGATLVLGQQGSSSIAAGTVNVSGTSSLGVANVVLGGNNAAFNAYGVFNLNGGTVTTGSIRKGSSNTAASATANVFHANGGTVKVSTHANNANFFLGAHVNIKSGGLNFNTNGNDTTISNTLNGDATSAGGGFTKQGNGILTLNASSTYTGLTTIDGGTLKLGSSGALGSTSGVSLGTSGTFDVSDKSGGYSVTNLVGSGTVTGSMAVTSQLAIGNSPGTIDFDNLTLGGSSTFLHELTGGTTGSGSADLGNVGGTLDLGGATLDLVQLGAYTIGDVFTLFSYQNLVGTFAGLVEGDIFTDAGGEWMISYDATAGTNGGTESKFITVTAVPEPTAACIGLIGSLALLHRRRMA